MELEYIGIVIHFGLLYMKNKREQIVTCSSFTNVLQPVKGAHSHKRFDFLIRCSISQAT